MSSPSPFTDFVWWSVSDMDAAGMPHDLPQDALGVLEVRLPDGESAVELQILRGPSGRTVGLWYWELDGVVAIVVAANA